jgi:lysophosphatidic acid acyltransferase/lysophosphatidylinositol acyltransferase
LLLFPEGTRFTPEKHAAAVEFARSKGLPVFKHLLVPRAKGFHFVRQQFKVSVKKKIEIDVNSTFVL